MGSAPGSSPAPPPALRRLAGGLPAIVQSNPLSDSLTVALLMSAPVTDGLRPDDLPGVGWISRSGAPDQLNDLVAQLSKAARNARGAVAEPPSMDPATRLQQLIQARMKSNEQPMPRPLAIIASGNLPPEPMFAALKRRFDAIPAARLPNASIDANPHGPSIVREHIGKPLAQGSLGYVVEAPVPTTRAGLAAQMILYILTHDYSGRLGRSAIGDKGIVYHIYSTYPTDGRHGWITLSTGVDPDKAEAMERELSEREFLSPGNPKPVFNDYPDLHPAIGRLLLKTFNRQVEARFPTDEAVKEDETGFTELVHTLGICARTVDNVRLEISAWTTTCGSRDEPRRAMIGVAERWDQRASPVVASRP